MDGIVRYCRNCGAHIPENAMVCAVCGCSVEKFHPAGAQDSWADFGTRDAFAYMNTEVNESAPCGHADWAEEAVRAESTRQEAPKPASAPVQRPGAGSNDASAGGADSKQNKQASPVVGMMFGRAGQQIYNQHNNANAGAEKPANAAADNAANDGKAGLKRSKWEAFFLCLTLGLLGAHRVYEHKYRKGIFYLFGFSVILAMSYAPGVSYEGPIFHAVVIFLSIYALAWIFDLITLLSKPNPYYI